MRTDTVPKYPYMFRVRYIQNCTLGQARLFLSHSGLWLFGSGGKSLARQPLPGAPVATAPGISMDGAGEAGVSGHAALGRMWMGAAPNQEPYVI